MPYFDVGVRDRAAQHADEALKLYADNFDPMAVATMHIQVARALLEAGRVRDAEASLAKATDIFGTLDLRTELAMARLAHGYALARSGQSAQAEVLLLAARDTFEEVGRNLELARATNELARLYRIESRGDEVAPLLERALDLLQGDDPNELALTHRELALCAGSGGAERAEKHLRRALELFELGEDRVQLAATYGLLGDLMRAKNRPDEACEADRSGVAQLIEPSDTFASSA